MKKIQTKKIPMRNIGIFLLVMVFFISACSQPKQQDFVGGGTPVQPATQNTIQSTTQDTEGTKQDTESATQGNGFKEFKMTARQFAFEPSVIEVNKGDKVRLIVTSKDVPHGISIPEYGINERLDPGKPATIEFIADKEGTFTTFCSVFCGSGHSNMKGKIVVR